MDLYELGYFGNKAHASDIATAYYDTNVKLVVNMNIHLKNPISH